MKDNLKEFVDCHKEEFIYEFSHVDECWGKIEKGLSPAITIRKIIKYSSSLAAGIVFLISLSVFWGAYNNTKEYRREGIALHNVSLELAETEAYYQGQINSMINTINLNYGGLNATLLESIKQLDGDYEALKKDLSDNNRNDEVIDAMISYYRVKLSLLGQILDELKKNGQGLNVDANDVQKI